jgi:general stress protein 26
MYNITLVGKIEIITDPKVKQEMWYEQLEDQFSGPEDENYCVLKFTTERYNISFDFEVDSGKL